MSFVLNNMIFDRVVGATVAEKNDRVKAWLSQLSNISFNVSADPVEIADAMGNIVYRKYNAKNLEITATNAFISTDVIALTSGTDMLYATEDMPLEFPKIEEVRVGKEDEDGNVVAPKLTVSGVKEGTVEVYGLTASGAMSTEYFGLAGTNVPGTETPVDAEHQFSVAGTELTLPTYTDSVITKFLVKYTRTVTSGMMAKNYGDAFSRTTELVFKCLAVDPCDQKLRAAYIVVPSASISPDVELAIANGESNTIDFSAQALLDMCADDKTLFYVAFAEEDEEE